MANEQDTNRGVDLLAEALKEKTCKDVYGLHTWEKHEETLQEYCKHCFTRKDVWEQENPQTTVKTATKTLDKVPEQLRPHVFQPGNNANPNGRPVGSKNLTTLFREVLRNKKYTVKNEATGQTIEIDGETALVEKALENAIKKGDRESIRMIWEMFDGKPTQQHKLEVSGPKGYEIDPNREKLYQEQFTAVADIPGLPERSQEAQNDTKQAEVVEMPKEEPKTPPTPQNERTAGVTEAQPTPHGVTTTTQENNGGGVREA